MRYLLHVKRDSGQVMVAAAVPDGEPLPFNLADDSCDIHAVGELGYDRIQAAMPFVCYDAHGAVIPGDQPAPDHQFDFKARGWVIDPGIAWERVKQSRASAVERIVVTTSTGKKFDGDEASQDRMARAVAVGVPGQNTRWKLATNNWAQVTYEELKEALQLAGAEQTIIWEHGI